jgi:hypothetical protein
MILSEVAAGIGARVLTHPSRMEQIQIHRVSAADKMSDLIDEASDSTLLVSHLSNPHLLRIADLLDVPCICLLDDAQPQEHLVLAAQESGKVLMVSPEGMAETCRRLGLHGLTCLNRSG